MEKSTPAVRPFGIYDKLGYAFGDFGCNLSFSLISNYMFLFYTQCIGLSTSHWAWIIIVSKVWDAINDIVIGSLVDRIQIGKKSKFKPWITIGSFGIVVFTVMIFAPVKNFSETGKILWCLVSYCLWSVAYTTINVPYGSIHSVITDDAAGRTSLSTFRSIGATLGMLFIMILPKLVYTDNKLDENKIFIVSAVFSLMAFVLLFFMRKMVSERVVRNSKREKQNYFSTLKSYFTNRPLMGITIATIASVICFSSTASANNLVFQFYFNDAEKAVIGTLVSYIPMFIIMAVTGKITAKIGKKKYICIASLVGTVAGILMLFLPITPDSTGMIIYIAGLMFVNIGNAVFQIIVWAIVADCTELSFRKTGIREESSIYAIYSFFRKLSQGIGQSLLAVLLASTGYVENSATQTIEAATGIKNVYITLLLAGTAVVFLSMTFIYNISHKQELEFGNGNKQ